MSAEMISAAARLQRARQAYLRAGGADRDAAYERLLEAKAAYLRLENGVLRATIARSGREVSTA